MAEQNDRKRGRSVLEEEEEIDFPEVKKLREDLLESFEEEDDDDICTTSEDLDSFMKSFEEEISGTETVIDLSLESGESGVELGFLLEASDDELGLPPSKEVSEFDSEGISELWEFEDRMTSFELFGTGGGTEYLALDGLFDYSDIGWHPETLPAQ